LNNVNYLKYYLRVINLFMLLDDKPMNISVKHNLLSDKKKTNSWLFQL